MPAGPALFHPSGGLGYHLRAWRHAGTLWRPYRQAVAAWLARWQPAADHLVLVGPSAGYSLDPAFLARFARITALEPDPLARWLLRRRFPRLPLRFDRPLAHPAELPQRHPNAAHLFCNLLGQTLQGSNTDWLPHLATTLAGRPWASYHDLVATPRQPNAMGPIDLDRLPPLEDLLARFWQGGELEITDLETHGLCPGAPRSYAIWHLTPGQYHLVEWIAPP